MVKLIVTHINPDLDALSSIWLIKRFFPTWEKADMQFVPAGKTFRGAPPDDDQEIIHVDTGFGKYDHHQTAKFTCAAELVYKEVKKRQKLSEDNQKALERFIKVNVELDSGRDISWEDAQNDRYEFMVSNFMASIKFSQEKKDEEKVNYFLPIIDAIFQTIKNKIKAENEIKKGKEFETLWGKGIGMETGLDDVLTVGEKMGYSLVVKKNPKDGHVRIFGRWDKKIDLTKAFGKFQKKDPMASWYLHPSKCLLLNGSRSDPDMVPTKLSLEEIIKIVGKKKPS
ncbi:hypothetical protein COT44_04120 [Candidatus Shapirobacteria bacterium CG08_land_8_20_14_0_20_39_18]|uniref:Uncharacterized protein n=1 Tax=Candidatus Shapirobacteria bacterium CG08_land_8_20_14_0_20_39_18 TaxID=1974883 RepID=A0A2M6XC83_9BACT|nr:MAG: hypothetical protein COT44_04120 [Candidatus Shapirobacteria bacterium CG08_land_8_20_14_0_20_39_18]PIY66052.1 MAG: hypothetical protein COY91_01095 [Candidatus Shapirobacteria bacterium CG_4_10_14_0_8_um_filter_39_15]PJE68736.1 MAG: hypothetical protein COU94_00605 [Candidatus Shapirobacteria bacterium CG10_big_fil_rev_8_21_14_0_10_38_8]